jgi:hypothetical protein
MEDKLEHVLIDTIICGGVTLAEGHEKWSNYRNQFKQLCDLLKNK